MSTLLVSVLLTSSGCFSYVPVSLASAPAKEEVRVLITDEAGARLVKSLGTYTTILEGEVAPQGDSVSIAVPIVREFRGTVLASAPQVLYLAKPEILEIRRRQLSRRRTVIASAATVAVFGALVATVVAMTDPNPGSDDGLPPPPPPAGRRVPARMPFIIQLRIP
jgi:hypothetical protein